MTGVENRSSLDRYVRALSLFAIGVAVLGHGMAATLLVAEPPTLLTVALPVVGATAAYRSFVDLLPSKSPLSAPVFLALFVGAITLVANAAAPAVYALVGVTPATPTAAVGYWRPLVTGIAAFAGLGIYRTTAGRFGPRRPTLDAFAAALVAVGIVGLALARLSGRSFPGIELASALPPVAGAVVAVAVFDAAPRQ